MGKRAMEQLLKVIEQPRKGGNFGGCQLIEKKEPGEGSSYK